jgi:hypothetical protein
MRDEEFESLSYEELVQLTLEEAKHVDDTKKKRIRILAKKLEDTGSPKYMISQKITRDLQGWVNSKYVRECLGEGYKDVKLVREQNTSERRGSTPAVEGKNLLVGIANGGKQETTTVLPTEQPVEDYEVHRQVSIQSLQDKIRILERERDYYTMKLAEKSPEFRELYEEIKELKEIESKRVERDFSCAELLPAKNESQQKIKSLERRIKEQDTLLAKDTFETELELKQQIIPVIIFIDRVTGKAQAKVDTSKIKRLMS